MDSDKQVRAETWLKSEVVCHSLPKDPRSHSSTAISERLEVIQLQNREQEDRRVCRCNPEDQPPVSCFSGVVCLVCND